MMSISLGPLALPTAPLLVLLCTLLAAWTADRVAATRTAASTSTDDRASQSAGTLLTQAVLVALTAARLAHVSLYLDAYRTEPWTLLDVRDGGWNTAAGMLGGVGWMVWQAWRHPAWRKALVISTTAGLVAWSVGTAGLDALAPRDLPDLVLTDLATGQPVRLREVAARGPIVVNLWASWCGPCRREMPVLAAAQARHPEVTFILVNQGEQAETVRHYLDSQRLVLSGVLLDAGSRLGPALGSGGLPTTVFFDRRGRRADAHMGALNGATLVIRLGTLSTQ